MRYLALACDYDGTLASHGRVEASTVAALERVRATGRKLLLVTGRQLDDLRSVFVEIDLFETIVAENGALLYDPRTRRERTIAEPPPAAFVEALRRRYVPLAVGRVIVATWEPHEREVLETIRDLGLELHVIFNKGAVMTLPAGVSKASGLAAALAELGLSPHNVVGVGDAENDHAFLSSCECAVAVANALPTIKERSDVVTKGEAGAGVEELAAELVENDLKAWEPHLGRHGILLGKQAVEDGATPPEVRIAPYGSVVLVAGSSGAGKSTLATGVLERILERDYQCCVIDPEGDYAAVGGAVSIGNAQRAPTDEEVASILQDPRANAIVDLTGARVIDRPAAFAKLMARLYDLLTRTGRPHWLLVDEAHHVAPASMEPNAALAAERPGGLLLITVEPKSVTPALLATVTVAATVGPAAIAAMAELADALGESAPALPAQPPPEGHALVWPRASGEPPFVMRIEPGTTARERHVRKYAEGELAPDRSFYFRGPDRSLNLRAQNLILFTQLADGVDDRTWLHHLHRGDYSTWFREQIKDRDLADEAASVERTEGISAGRSRELIREAIERRYTAPV
jgi:hydroxymethylpyrimidine pyrophosphatase-like HAD family hydrolase